MTMQMMSSYIRFKEKDSERTDRTKQRARPTNKEPQFDLLDKRLETLLMNSPRHPTCDEFMRMPLCEEVLEHIRSCDSCRALVNQLADDVDRRAFEYQHRN